MGLASFINWLIRKIFNGVFHLQRHWNSELSENVIDLSRSYLWNLLNYTKSHLEYNCKNICFCIIFWVYTAILLWHVTSSKRFGRKRSWPNQSIILAFFVWLRKITKNFSEGSEFSVRKFNQRPTRLCVCVCVCVWRVRGRGSRYKETKTETAPPLR